MQYSPYLQSSLYIAVLRLEISKNRWKVRSTVATRSCLLWSLNSNNQLYLSWAVVRALCLTRRPAHHYPVKLERRTELRINNTHSWTNSDWVLHGHRTPRYFKPHHFQPRRPRSRLDWKLEIFIIFLWSWQGCRPNLCISLHQFESRIQGNATDMTKYQTKVGALDNVNTTHNLKYSRFQVYMIIY